MRIHGDFREQQAVDWVEMLLWESTPCRWPQMHQGGGACSDRVKGVCVEGDLRLRTQDKEKQRRTFRKHPSPVLKPQKIA